MRASFQEIRDFPSRQFLKGNVPKHEVVEHAKRRFTAMEAVRKYIVAQSFNWAVFDDPDRIEAAIVGLKKSNVRKQFTVGKESKAWAGSGLT